ncbi:carbohydrate ABC transporter permease [Hoeflea poritis]|uniref:Carbohydrate ABC transporter permease n=1 Tax=Hoeflea poritis TaxID=2993659 RepID=A0ABT4VHL1_9HYPH|nr:carbohydrate ABC transporter permease [Hoeflea poritis]MDA4844196.1 carbohydrate ABC transporter permease [Hoeflea poritis]
MTRPGIGFIAAVVSGALWGACWMIVISVIFMLVSGAITRPPVGMALIAGAVSAAVLAAVAPPQRTPGIQMASIAAIIILLGGLTLGAPLGLPLSQVPVYQLAAVAILIALIWLSNKLVIGDLSGGHLPRYQLELMFIRLMKGLGFVVFTVIVALPFYVMVMTSLKSQQSLLANPLDFSIDLSQGAESLFRSYIELFTQFRFGTFLINSAIVSVATVIITLAFSIPGAYAVSRLRFPGQAFLSRSILLIYMVPAIVLVIPLYAVFSQLGLRNTLTGLMIVYPATTIPVALYMLQGYFRGLPAELEEAGLMDGLTRVGVIMKITLPLSLPALASVALYVFMIAWNEFLFAFMFLDNIDIFTLSRGVVSLNSSEVPRQHLMAGAVVATVPVLFIFLWFERFLVSGLTAGSVKG